MSQKPKLIDLLVPVVVVAGVAGWYFHHAAPIPSPPPRQTHPGFSSPNRLDSTLIRLRLGTARYAIPANYFDAPLEVKGKDGEYSIVDGFFLRGLLPGFEGRTGSNSNVFMKTLGWGPKVSFLVIVPGFSPPEAMRRQRARELGDGWRDRAVGSSTFEGVLELELSNKGRGSDRQDAFIDAKTEHYTVCKRRQPPMVLSPSCAHKGENDNVLYKITYGREHHENHVDVLSTVLAKLKSWEVR